MPKTDPLVYQELSAEEEKRLLREGTEEARLKVVQACMPQATEYVRTACRNQFNTTEQRSIAGNVLLTCVKRCNPEKGRLIVYARPYLRGAVRRAWREREVVKFGPRMPDTSLPIKDEVEEALDRPDETLMKWVSISERMEIIRPLLRSLTERERLVLHLHYEMGYSFATIARVYLHTSREVANKTHQKTLRAIRNWLMDAKVWNDLKEAE